MKRKPLWFNGHIYRDAGPAPCPIPGCSNGTVATTHNGLPAYWQKGRLYVRDYSSEPPADQNPWHIEWEAK
jgi:hypothetical protein